MILQGTTNPVHEKGFGAWRNYVTREQCGVFSKKKYPTVTSLNECSRPPEQIWLSAAACGRSCAAVFTSSVQWGCHQLRQLYMTHGAHFFPTRQRFATNAAHARHFVVGNEGCTAVYVLSPKQK